MKSPQMKNWEKRIGRGLVVVRAALDPINGDGDAIAQWQALVARHGGPKPALLALLRAHN